MKIVKKSYINDDMQLITEHVAIKANGSEELRRVYTMYPNNHYHCWDYKHGDVIDRVSFVVYLANEVTPLVTEEEMRSIFKPLLEKEQWFTYAFEKYMKKHNGYEQHTGEVYKWYIQLKKHPTDETLMDFVYTRQATHTRWYNKSKKYREKILKMVYSIRKTSPELAEYIFNWMLYLNQDEVDWMTDGYKKWAYMFSSRGSWEDLRSIMNTFSRDRDEVAMNIFELTNRDIQWCLSLATRDDNERDHWHRRDLWYDLQPWHDYLLACRREGRDISDPYWRYNRQWREEHQAQIERARQLKAIEAKQCQATFQQKVEMYKHRDVLIDGYRVYVPELYDWEKQASVLHQCILSSEYYKKADSVIVFVRKDDVPVATFEILLKEQRIGQFYENERNAAHGRPTKETRAIVDKYMEMYPKW